MVACASFAALENVNVLLPSPSPRPPSCWRVFTLHVPVPACRVCPRVRACLRVRRALPLGTSRGVAESGLQGFCFAGRCLLCSRAGRLVPVRNVWAPASFPRLVPGVGTMLPCCIPTARGPEHVSRSRRVGTLLQTCLSLFLASPFLGRVARLRSVRPPLVASQTPSRGPWLVSTFSHAAF